MSPSIRRWAFLEKYPDARDEITSNPGNFVTPGPGSKWNSHEAAAFRATDQLTETPTSGSAGREGSRYPNASALN